jgi:hypothetical protein
MGMRGPLGNIEAKVHRGLEHVQELESLEADFFGPVPYEIVDNAEEGTGWRVVTASIMREPPAKLGIVAGEAVHQFRSSLDHLVKLAVGLTGHTYRGTFPICRSAAAFKEAEGTLRARLRGAHFDVLVRVQPYNVDPIHPESARLAVMSTFDNADKHDAVQVGYAVLRGASFQGVKDVEYAGPVQIGNGTTLCRYLPSGPETEFRRLLTLGIAYSVVPRWQVNVASLREIGYDVREIVESFREGTPEFSIQPASAG